MDDGYKRPQNGNGLQSRCRDGKFLPGNTLGKSGRPKGAVGFAKRIRMETHGGRDLIATELAISRDLTHKDCLRAVEFLTERMLGKPRELEP